MLKSLGYGVACLAASTLVCSVAWSDDDTDPKKKQVRNKRRVIVRAADDDEAGPADRVRKRVIVRDAAAAGRIPSHWIGVMAVPVRDVLKSQLGVKHGLAVEQVVDDGPAAKAGVKKHDILTKFADRQLTDLDSLVEAVEKNGGAEASLVVLRRGSEKTLSIQPAKRPASSFRIEADLDGDFDFEDLRKKLQRGNGRMLFFGPGLRFPKGFEFKQAFPNLPGGGADGLSIQIQKENDKPAKIVVKRGEESWEVTEETLDKLPKDLRAVVKARLQGGGPAAARVIIPNLESKIEALRRNRAGNRGPQLRLDFGDFKNIETDLQKSMKQLMKQIEDLRRELDSIKKESDRKDDDKENDSIET